MGDDACATRELRLRSQGLTAPRAASVAAVTRRLVGVQAQALAFARLAFRPRCTRTVLAADVDAALRDGTLVWTWALRGTLHLVPAEDAGWLLGLLGPIFTARGRPRRLALGLDDASCERAVEVLREAVASGERWTRSALAARVGIDAGGQAPAHLVAYAAMAGVLRRVPGREPTFARLGLEVDAVDEDEALTRLARRYRAGYGPVAPEDLAAWSGIGLRRARRAFAEIGDEPAGAAAEPSPQHVALLGQFDPWLLGYASRDLALEPRFAKRIQAGGGFVAAAAIVDGRVVGTWRRGELEPFEALPAGVLAALQGDLADVERFLTHAP